MEDKILIIVVLLVSELISLLLLVKLFRSPAPIIYKVVVAVITLLPVVGPLLFMFIHNMPDKLPLESRATMNHYGRGGKFIGFGGSRYNYDIVQEDDELDDEIENTSSKRKKKKKRSKKNRS